MIKIMAEKAQAAKKRLLKEDGKKDGQEAAADSDEEDEGPFDREELESDVKKYETFWSEFGKALKLGVCSTLSSATSMSRCHHVRPISILGAVEAAVMESVLFAGAFKQLWCIVWRDCAGA